jgi:leucyl-tRNA synthetase
VTKAFYDWRLINFDEPFTRFRAHGLLIKEGAKMSKSKGNVVNPDEYISKYGADSLRMYLMFLAPFEEGGDFRDSGIKGIVRFLNRVWEFCNNLENKNSKELDKNIDTILHQTIKNVSEDIENLKYNTAISKLMVLLNEFEKNKDLIKKEEVEIFLKLLAPFAPHITEELWHNFGNKESIHKMNWPDFDPEKIKEEEFDLIIQVNGKLKDTAKTKKDITREEAEEIALKSEKVKNHINKREIKKVIFVENKLINFVV